MFINKKTIFQAAALIILVFLLSSCGGGPPPICTADFLIWSINNANSNGPGTDTIDLDPGCIYELATVDNTTDGNNGLPSITTSIIINGYGATIRRSTAAQKSAIRLLHISQGGDLEINDLILLDGLAMEPTNVTLLLPNSGGAILNRGNLTVNKSIISANYAKLKGGGIYNEGSMEVNTTTIKDNEVNIGNEPNESGGGILNAGTATIVDSTISKNIASQSAGGIGNSGDLTITNSTISGNYTTLAGIVSGAAIINAGNAEIGYTTIANNVGTTSGAVFSAPDTITIHNTIIADNSPSNCSYPTTSMILGPNMDSDGSCGGMTTANPQLGPLADNGGLTLTHALSPTSPARDAAFGLHPPTDQRGKTRPQGPASDLGSFEVVAGSGAGDSSFISGFVFDDSNADGVFDPAELGLAGVELVLENGPCLTPVSAVSELSASDGSYEFEILPPTAGTYCLTVDPQAPTNVNILIPGGFIVPPGGEIELNLTEGEDLADINFGWDFQFAGADLAPNPVITNVVLSTTTPPDGGWVEVEVTIENQGAYPAEDYELVLIPHYGWGPPNPAGYVALPDLIPGVPHTEVFSPGVLYSPAGTYTLRVLVTDDWYALGDPDSTGTNGDYQDFEITVLPALSRCFPFEDMELSLVLLKIRPDTMSLPLYFKTTGDFPGMIPDDSEPDEYYALLGDNESNSCGLQGGFSDRLYCMFTLPEEAPGKAMDLSLYRKDCQDPVYVQTKVTIPDLPEEEPSPPACNKDLDQDACEEAGGEMSSGLTTAPYCICP
jgi:hypothetical protein